MTYTDAFWTMVVLTLGLAKTIWLLIWAVRALLKYSHLVFVNPLDYYSLLRTKIDPDDYDSYPKDK